MRNNFGKHLWDLEDGQLRTALMYCQSPYYTIHVVRLIHSVYICSASYYFALSFVKASLIVFYLQVFQERRFRIACWAILVFIAITTIILQSLAIFVCSPVPAFWDRDIKGKCLNVAVMANANSIVAIMLDLIILVAPMPSLLGLQMKLSRKISVAFMFAIGAW